MENVKGKVIKFIENELKFRKILISSKDEDREISVYIKETRAYVLCINITTMNSYINTNREIHSYFTNEGIKYNLVNLFFVNSLNGIKDTYFQTDFYEEGIFIDINGNIECFNVHNVGFLNLIKDFLEGKKRGQVKKNNYLTMGIILITLVSYFLLVSINGSVYEIKDEVLLWAGGKIDPLIEGGDYLRILISPFLHKNFVQMILGIITLFFLGSIVEKNISKFKYLLLIFLSVLFGSIGSYILNFSTFFEVGLYEINYGLIGGVFILAFKYRNKVNKLFFLFLFSFIILNLVSAIVLGNIDNFGSLVSFITGLVYMKIIDTIKR